MKRRLVIRLHASQRMLERGIHIAEVEQVVESGEVLEVYPEDTPFPSRLLLGFTGNRPIHVVAADDPGGDVTHVVTTYEPDPDQWDEGFRRRK